MRYKSTLENAFNDSMDAERKLKKQLEWALEWLAYYKAQYDGNYGKEGATTVEQLREQSKTGRAPA